MKLAHGRLSRAVHALVRAAQSRSAHIELHSINQHDTFLVHMAKRDAQSTSSVLCPDVTLPPSPHYLDIDTFRYPQASGR